MNETEKPQSPQKQVPLGEPLTWSDEELDALAEVSPADVLEAQGWARRNAKPTDQPFWDAKPVENDTQAQK